MRRVTRSRRRPVSAWGRGLLDDAPGPVRRGATAGIQPPGRGAALRARSPRTPYASFDELLELLELLDAGIAPISAAKAAPSDCSELIRVSMSLNICCRKSVYWVTSWFILVIWFCASVISWLME